MAWALANASKTAAVNGVTVLCNSGTINLYSGSRPATPDTAVTTQVLLATLTFSATAFSGTTNGVATAGSISSGTGTSGATANGTSCTWARILKSDAITVVGDCNVGLSGSDINLSDTIIVTGETVSITSLTLTQP